MFHSGDQVMYGIHGLCKILGTEVRRVDKKNVEYYILQPVSQPASRYYIPTQNEAAVAKLHPVISSEDLNTMLEDTITDAWIDDESQRKQLYKQLISGGDRSALIRMAHSVYMQQKQLNEQGKKLHMCDANFLRDAEKLLKSELSTVLGIPAEEINAYIANVMANK